jgi:hypothetical protein
MRPSFPTQRIETPYQLLAVQVAADSGRRLLRTMPRLQLLVLPL